MEQKRHRQPTITETIKSNKKRLLFLLFIFLFIAHTAGLSSPTTAAHQFTKLPLTPLANVKKWIPDAQYFLGLRRRPGIIVHPIPKLMADAQRNYKQFLARQSTTVFQASKEYRKRYKRDPPKGFDEWFAFATENGSKVIDDYDQLMADLAPFWELCGEELRRRVVQVCLYAHWY
jgi:hypothetical protein